MTAPMSSQSAPIAERISAIPPLSKGEGKCSCGCGSAAPIAARSDRRSGVRKGERLRFISGHNRRGTTDLARWEVANCGYSSDCWVWQGALSRKGYGRAQVAGEHTGAHRAVYEATYGQLADDAHLDHLCRNRACVRPDHMEVVSNATNSRRACRTKLTSELVDLIRGNSRSATALAAELGVSRQAISDVRRGRSWSALALVHRMIALTEAAP